jgi:hypothetical protein
VAGPLALPAAAGAQSGTITQGIDERPQITSLVDRYFKTKYEGQRLLRPQDFGGLVHDALPKAKQFLKAERDKREVELFQADLFNLRYTQYDYALDFADIRVDTAAKEATVTVSEGHDVVYACSAPVVSLLRGVKHTITLKQVGEDWRIVEDAYVDDMRRMLQGAGSKDQLAARIRAAKDRGHKAPTESYPVPKGDRPPTSDGQIGTMAVGDAHAYDRYAAWYYASVHWQNYNPHYYAYPDNDCTNFISQCMRHGGCAFDTGGSYQWYYYGPNPPARSYSWTGVVELWNYLINNNWTGPNGEPRWVDGLELADLVQLNFGYGWQHCPIIVDIGAPRFDAILCAAHSDNCFNRPLSVWSGADVRFMHIIHWRE